MTQTIDPPAQPAKTNGELAKVTRAYEPLAPIRTAGALKNLLDAQRNGIAQALPKHITPERLIKTLLVAANRTPKLLDCTQSSLLETINRAAELGLDLSGTLGEAYPVPFNNKVKDADGNDVWVNQCQLIIGYRGLAKLARQSNEIKRIDADVVCENDTFVFRKGSDARCEFTPNLKGDRGKAVGAYAFVQFKDGGEQFDFMPVDDIEKVRARAQSKNSPAWRDHWPEMAKKTVFRRVAKWLPLSTEKFVAAMEQDDADYALADVLSAQTGPAEKGAAALTRRLTQRPLSENQTLEPSPEALAEANAAQQASNAEPDVSGAQAEPEAVTFATFEEFKQAMIDLAIERNIKPSEVENIIGTAVVSAGAKGKENKIPAETLRAWYADFSGGVV